MKALLHSEAARELPSVAKWFRHAEATRRIAHERHGQLKGSDLERAVIEENVLVQLNNLTTHPYITSRLARGQIHLYGWYYDIGTGQILAYNQDHGEFQPLGESAKPARPLSIRVCKETLAARDGQVAVAG
jgi:carbonic anhydrase